MHLLEYLKFRALITPSAVKNVDQQELSFIAHENAKWYGHFVRQFGNCLQN